MRIKRLLFLLAALAISLPLFSQEYIGDSPQIPPCPLTSPTLPIQVSPFQRVRLGPAIGFLVSGKTRAGGLPKADNFSNFVRDKTIFRGMKVVIQRVSSASIGEGLLVLLGVGHEDSEEDIQWLVRKVSGLRIFNDENGVMNRSILDTGGDIIVVSQFTLMASTRKGNRPSYIGAAGHEKAIPLYEQFCDTLSQAIGKPVGTGEFGADMKVALVNDGPVTICIDTKDKE